MVAKKTGALTAEELMQLWVSITDPEYHNPLIEKSGSNVEVIEQAAHQLARVSQQVDANTQAMFILPWSGQTSEPASGAMFARTILQITRSGQFEVPIVFNKGDIVFEHWLSDYSKEGSVLVTTNRKFVVEESNAFGVGEAGPLGITVVAQNPGPGYNEVSPNTLTIVSQPGAGFSNSGATVENGTETSNRVVTTTFPDVPIVGHIGQYLLFTQGANLGRYVRIVGIENADVAVPHGGIFNVAAEAILRVVVVSGTFTYGERIEFSYGAIGFFVSLYNDKLVVQCSQGTIPNTGNATGEFGALVFVLDKEQDERLVPEIGSAGWLVVGWHDHLLLSVTNPEVPTGGRSGFLDELGNERKMPRLNAESDDEYRKRIATLVDVVSPGAVIRAGNKIVESYGGEVCLREVGRSLFPGFFYDGAPNQLPFAYDLDLVELSLLGGNQYGSGFLFLDECPSGFYDNPAPQTNWNFFSESSFNESTGRVDGFIPGEIVHSTGSDGRITFGIATFDYVVGTTQRVFRGATKVVGPGFEIGRLLYGETSQFVQAIVAVGPGVLPEHRFYTILNLREFRGFFLVGVPRLALDDFGFFYDFGPNNAYDTNAIDNFLDGAAIGTNSLYSRIYDAVDAVRPAGVPFDIYIEDEGCS